MLDFGFYNMDCMEGMKQFPDNFFDIAIVDPPYGGVTRGGYMKNQSSGGVAKNKNDYHLSLWACGKPPSEYYKELFRVSKAQVIWGGTTSQAIFQSRSVGYVGTKTSRKASSLLIANLRGLLTTGERSCLGLHGMA